MKRWKFYSLAIFSLAAVVIAPLVCSPQANGWADEDAEESTEATPTAALEAPLDPAFAKYVDIDLLIDAWSDLDPALMTDVALQLAEGERVLLRPHKAGSAADLLALAARLAGKNNDQATLARIGKAAELLASEEVADQVASAAKLAGASRADEPALSVSVAAANVDDIAFYSGAVQGIRAAELVGDVEAITDIQENVDSFKGLTAQQKEYLKTIAGNAIESSGDVGDSNSVAASLRKLSGTSRGGFYIGLPGGGGFAFGNGGGYGHGGGYGYGSGYGNGGGYGHGSGYGHGGGNNFGGHDHDDHNHSGHNYGGHGYGGHNYGGNGRGGHGYSGHGYGGHGRGHIYRPSRSRWGHGGGWGHGGWSYP